MMMETTTKTSSIGKQSCERQQKQTMMMRIETCATSGKL
jgi:hypothetical protein